ncbi:MAG: hypothetical protein Pg6C_16630 [Treponemataceae bacterium]|nr:MAG: hypothetical protein Pg6C_16630 [Treponemataceae bacterium]
MPKSYEGDRTIKSANGKKGGISLNAYARLFPTPDTRGFTNTGSLELLAAASGIREEFVRMAYRANGKRKRAIWPTPRAGDGNEPPVSRTVPGGGYRHNLCEAVHLWRTSDANMDRGNRTYENMKMRIGKGKPLNLNDQLNAISLGLLSKPKVWGTPTANDAKNSLTESQRGRGTLTASIVENEGKMNGRLNSDWVERLMGYPDKWTDIDAEEVEAKLLYPDAWQNGTWDTIPRITSGQKHRQARLKCLGNAVVPQIPQLIWGLVMEAL